MGDNVQHPDVLFRRHECLKRLLGQPERIDPQRSNEMEHDKIAAECDLAAQESLWFLDLAYLTGNEALIHTAIFAWNRAIDRR